jgi:hypothetical protein
LTRILYGLIFVCFALACARQSSPELVIAHEVSPQPARVGQVTITLRLTDGSGKPITGAHATLEGNMSHAGMVPVFAETTEIEPGRYRANLELSMAGDWVMLVHVSFPGNLKVDRQFEIRGVLPA